MRLSSALIVAGCAFALPACRTKNIWHALDFSWNRMQQQPRYQPYRDSAFFTDGIAMRTPPGGTRPYSAAAADDRMNDGTVDGQDVDTLPLPVTMTLLERGRMQFDIICAACHGPAGDGNTVAARFMERRPPSLTEIRVRLLPDGRLYKVIRDGYGVMPSYGTHLDVTDRWAVVAYVRALERSRHAVAARLPEAVSADLQRSAP